MPLEHVRLQMSMDKAIVQGDGDCVERYLNGGADPNTKTQELGSVRISLVALTVSTGVRHVQKDNLRILRMLLNAGASPNGIYPVSTTCIGAPLSVAVHHCRLEMVQILLDADVAVDERVYFTDPDQKAERHLSGATALSIAIWNGRVDILLALLGAGADVNHRSDYGFNPLLTAIDHSDWFYSVVTQQIIGILLNAGADIHCESSNRITPLMSAVMQNRLEIVNLLLKHGADVNRRSTSTSGRNTALAMAAYAGSLPMVKHLMKAGAAVDSSHLCAVLHSAHYQSWQSWTRVDELRTDHVEIANIFERAGASFDFLTSNPPYSARRGFYALKTLLRRRLQNVSLFGSLRFSPDLF